MSYQHAHQETVGAVVSRWPDCGPATVYTYGFSVWPDEQSPRWTRPMFDLFQMLKGRVELEFTERGFNDFREELAKHGFTLREIDRAPSLERRSVL